MDELIIRSVSKKIGRRDVLININLSLSKGNIYGLSGPNGSGKTMLFRAIAGLVRADEGEIIAYEKVIGKDQAFPDDLGIMIENVGFWPKLTGLEVLDMLRGIRGRASREDAAYAMERIGLDPKDKRRVKEYSLGMRQKLAIAQAIMEKPKLLILDEPGNSLDERANERLLRIIEEEKERGALVIVASHDMQPLSRLCSEVFRMQEGRIAPGKEEVAEA